MTTAAAAKIVESSSSVPTRRPSYEPWPISSSAPEGWGWGNKVVLSEENHTANLLPWIDANRRVGATVRWWTSPRIGSAVRGDDNGNSGGGEGCSCRDKTPKLLRLLTDRTRAVAVSHASNILGRVRDVRAVVRAVRSVSPSAHVIVDGVAAAPHVPPDVCRGRGEGGTGGGWDRTGTSYLATSCSGLTWGGCAVRGGRRWTSSQP